MNHKYVLSNFKLTDYGYNYTFVAKRTGTVIFQDVYGVPFSRITSHRASGNPNKYEEFSVSSNNVTLKAVKGNTYTLHYVGELPEITSSLHIKKAQAGDCQVFKLKANAIANRLSFVFDRIAVPNLQNLEVHMHCNGERIFKDPAEFDLYRDGCFYISYEDMPAGDYVLELYPSNLKEDTTMVLDGGLVVDKNYIVRQALLTGFKLKKLHNGCYGLLPYVFDFAVKMMEEFRGDE